MNQRKTMKLWQMLVLVILSAALLITIFLPAYHINGKAVVKMYNKLMSSNDLMSLAGAAADVDTDEIRQRVDEEIQEIEEENGIKISNITPGRIMTHSFTAFMGEEAVEEAGEALDGVKSSYGKQRVILWVIYMLAIMMIIVLILGFCLKWTKYIALTISTVYGLFVAVIFGIWQFLSPGSLAKNADLEGFMGMAGFTMDSQQGAALASIMGKMVSCFWGIAFLIGFIFAILLVIMSVVSLFVGNSNKAINDGPITQGDWVSDDGEEWRRKQAEREHQAELERQRREQQERERQKQLEREREEQLKKQREAQAAMGQVMCTKGVAAGQGFSLPEDRKVVVGKSSQNANLLINDAHVSNIHCSIRYKAATRSYIVKDHSSNGTFVNGVRLQKEIAMEFPAGTVLQLADGRNEITLG